MDHKYLTQIQLDAAKGKYTELLESEVGLLKQELRVVVMDSTKLITNAGYGSSTDTTQPGATGGTCLKFVYNNAGNSKAQYGIDNTSGLMEAALGKAGQYVVRGRLKANMTSSSVPTFAVVMMQRGTGQPLKQASGGTTNAEVIFTPAQIGLVWRWVEVPFYWDGVVPLELWTGRLPGGDLTSIIWQDQMVIRPVT